ncbi:MAG: glutathione peroxidase [Flavobacteriales bacterium]|nr:glutathione peroxidase [Flavobacteriales bacterium]
MKYIYLIILLLTTSFLFSFNNTNLKSKSPKTFPFELSINNIDGTSINLENFKGKNILFVNVASKCGFTNQYEALEKLSRRYKNELVVIGCPSNQFGQQEPGTHEEIIEFCKSNYGVTFLMTEKIIVKGDKIHPIYNWLTSSNLNGVLDSSVKWNFQKYFINKNGHLVDYFYSTTDPLSSKITNLIK